MDIFDEPHFKLEEEIKQRREEGCDVAAFEVLPISTLSIDTINSLHKYIAALPVAPDFPFIEPSDLDEIRSVRPDGPRRFRTELSDADFSDRVLGAWLGRCAGCLLGKPVEGWPRADIEALLAMTGETFPDDYMDSMPYPNPPHPHHPDIATWVKGGIIRMPADDDINYTMMALHILEKYGRDFATENVADEWLNLLTYTRVYTAERVAYQNLVNLMQAPQTAIFRNPYRE